MNAKGVLATVGALAFIVVGLGSYLVLPAFAGITQTYGNCQTAGKCNTQGGAGQTITTGVIGILAPTSSGFSSSLIITVVPLAFVAFFAVVGEWMKLKGDTMVHVVLGGNFVGSLVGDLSTQSAPAAGGGFIPFGMIVLSGIIWFLWWWNS